MSANPVLGVFFHWLGGLASGSFYVPYRGVRRWSWETYWLVGGFFSWIIAPWFLGHLMTRDLLSVLSEAPTSTLRSEEHTSELQSRFDLVCRLLLEKKKIYEF